MIFPILCHAAQGGCGMLLLLTVLLTNFTNVNNILVTPLCLLFWSGGTPMLLPPVASLLPNQPVL
jgi:hypothetical protein